MFKNFSERIIRFCDRLGIRIAIRIGLLGFALFVIFPHSQNVLNRKYPISLWDNLKIELDAAWPALLAAVIIVVLYWWIEWQHEKRSERERQENMKEIRDHLAALLKQIEGITTDKGKDKE